jgi:hypothetical protein
MEILLYSQRDMKSRTPPSLCRGEGRVRGSLKGILGQYGPFFKGIEKDYL